MKKKFLVFISIVMLMSIMVVPSSLAKKEDVPVVPFDGMSLTYYGNLFGNFVSRHIVVLRHNEITNTVTIRDAEDSMEVNLATREVLWATGWYADQLEEAGFFYAEYWIPTDIEIGDVVTIGTGDAEVVGSTILAVAGNPVEVWKLYATREYVDEGGSLIFVKNTWYYEKNTGLWVTASWAEIYEDGMVAKNYGLHLASSNVALTKKMKN